MKVEPTLPMKNDSFSRWTPMAIGVSSLLFILGEPMLYGEPLPEPSKSTGSQAARLMACF